MKKISTSLLFLALTSFALFSQTTQSFTSSGTFVVPSGVTSVTIEVVGAGGAGAGNGGSGGGGGGYAVGIYTVTPGQTLNVTVGIPGSGPLAGTTAVDMLIAATGGTNGAVDVNQNFGGGGPGGVGTGGTILNHTGGTGGGGYWTYFGGGGGGAAGPASNGATGGNSIAWTGICQTPGGAGGLGGGPPAGDGGKGAGFTDSGCNITDPAGNGSNYGAGGGGGNGNGGPAGTGVGGYCTITYGGCGVDVSTSVSGATITANESGATYQWIDCNTLTLIPGETGQSFTATQSGDYAVIVDDGSCFDTSACVTVLVCNLDITTSVSGATITANESGVTYQWIDCNTLTLIPGETGQSFTATQSGDYAVIIDDNGGCVDTSACVNIVVCTIDVSTSVSGTTITANESGATYQWVDCNTLTPIQGETGQSFTATQTSNYAVIIDNGSCVDTSACVTIIVCDIDTSTSVNGNTITSNESGATYQWIDCSTLAPIQGETGQSFTATLSGDYAVIIDDGDCVDTSACVIIHPLGINPTHEIQLSVFPNPFTTTINVVNAQGNEEYMLTNAIGQVIWTGTQIVQKDFSALTAGVYFLKIVNQPSAHPVKIVKQ